MPLLKVYYMKIQFMEGNRCLRNRIPAASDSALLPLRIALFAILVFFLSLFLDSSRE